MRPDSSNGLSPYVSRLGLKIGVSTGFAVATAFLLASRSSAGSAVLFGIGAAGVAYAAVHGWVHRRLFRLRSVLRQIRNQEFDAQSDLPGPGGDELDALLRAACRTGRSLEQDIQTLKERDNYRREFIGNVSHELKTPIFSAQGFAETLLDGALEDEEVNRRFLEKILHNVNRLDNLARDLSTITKIETDELEMASESFQVPEVFASTLESVEMRAEEKEIALRQEVAPDLPSVRGDRDRIRRVLVNLVDNAIKYNSEGGTVLLRAETQEDEVRISIIDDGIGIPEDHIPRLTERFYRVDKSRSRNQGGTGLGLAIVKHILEAHDRNLKVDSTPGEGSTFRFTLPTVHQSTLPPTHHA